MAIIAVVPVAVESISPLVPISDDDHAFSIPRCAITIFDDDSNRCMDQRAEETAQGPIACRSDSGDRHETNAQRPDGDSTNCSVLHFSFSFLVLMAAFRWSWR